MRCGMITKLQYEKRILNEIELMPKEALPKIYRLLSLIREEFVMKETTKGPAIESVNHTKTKSLLSTSKSDWAKDIITDREERL